MAGRIFWLFSYGSNSPARLAARLGHPVDALPAYLLDWRRVYRGHSRTWDGGVGSLEPDGNAVVFGNACRITRQDRDSIDRYEGYPRSYIRTTVQIHVFSPEGESVVDATVYLSTAEGGSPPSRAYLEAIAENVNSVWSKANGRPYRAVDFAPTATESK